MTHHYSNVFALLPPIDELNPKSNFLAIDSTNGNNYEPSLKKGTISQIELLMDSTEANSPENKFLYEKLELSGSDSSLVANQLVNMLKSIKFPKDKVKIQFKAKDPQAKTFVIKFPKNSLDEKSTQIIKEFFNKNKLLSSLILEQLIGNNAKKLMFEFKINSKTKKIEVSFYAKKNTPICEKYEQMDKELEDVMCELEKFIPFRPTSPLARRIQGLMTVSSKIMSSKLANSIARTKNLDFVVDGIQSGNLMQTDLSRMNVDINPVTVCSLYSKGRLSIEDVKEISKSIEKKPYGFKDANDILNYFESECQNFKLGIVYLGKFASLPIIEAIENDNNDITIPLIVKFLKEGYNPNLDEVDSFVFRTPIQKAARKGNIPVLSLLLQAGAELNKELLEDKQLPMDFGLYRALFENDYETLSFLAKNGGKFSFPYFILSIVRGDAFNRKITPSLEAVFADKNFISNLVNDPNQFFYSKEIREKIYSGNILFQAAKRKDLPLIEALVTAGADINAKDASGKSAAQYLVSTIF